MVDYYKGSFGFDDLQDILIRLRQPDGCPWDAAQTHTTIRKDFLEEVYEVCEAIDRADNTLLCEELGDVLWQVAFHTRLAEEEGAFTMEDVISGICKKMIERHPYVFGTVEKPASAEGTIAIHDAVKAQEKHQRTYTDAMNDVAKTLPALMYANKVQGRAKKSGFDWPSVEGAMDKVREESAEVQACLDKGEDITEEQVLADIKKRDANDSGREIAPAKPAEDAIFLDNSSLTPEQTVEAALRIVEEKLGTVTA